jgi:hypothetical protein
MAGILDGTNVPSPVIPVTDPPLSGDGEFSGAGASGEWNTPSESAPSSSDSDSSSSSD